MPLIPDSIHIWREPDGDHHIEWQASHPDTRVEVEPLVDAGTIERSEGGARVRGLPLNDRHYFRLRDQHGNEALVSERRLGLEGTPNFRDFGGYETQQGRRVKWGKLYRSGQLSTLTERDLELLDALNIDLVCDFRRQDEQQNEPSRLPSRRPPRVASLPITPGSNAAFFEQAGTDFGGPDTMFSFMVQINEDFAVAQTETYGRMFEEILSLDDASLLVHCAAGKDRTGFAAAIILLALGVSREVVMRDYLLTRRFFQPEAEIARLKQKYAMEHLPSEAVRPMLEVHQDYLARALDSIDERYPDIEAYLEQALGVGAAERGELRRRYLD
jgi:protein-tyrosine phosphatase